MIFAVAIGLIVNASVMAAQQPQPPEYNIIIDGKTAAGRAQIPEWHAWQSGFDDLAKNNPIIQATLEELGGVSEADMALTLKEAAEQPKRRRALDEKRMALTLQLAQRPLSELQAKAHDVELAYRRKILESRDRLSEQLSPEAFVTLSYWMEDRKKALEVYLPTKDDLAFYRQPQ